MENVRRKEGEGFSRIRTAIIALLTFILVTWFTYLLMYGGTSYQYYAPSSYPSESGAPTEASAPAGFDGGLLVVVVVIGAVLVGLLLVLIVLAVLAITALRSTRVAERRSEVLRVLNPIMDMVYHQPSRTSARNHHDLAREWRLVRTRIRAIVPVWGKETEMAFAELVDRTLQKYGVMSEDVIPWESDVMDVFDRFTESLWRDVERADRRTG